MKNSFKIIGLASLASVVLVAWSLVASSAFANDVSSDSFDKVSTNMRAWNMKQGKLGLGKWMKKNMTEEQKAEMEAKHEEMKAQHDAMKAAVDSNGFAAFQAAVVNSPLAEAITTQEQFDTFVAMHTAMQNDDKETAKALAEQLGIDKSMKGGMKWEYKEMKWEHKEMTKEMKGNKGKTKIRLFDKIGTSDSYEEFAAAHSETKIVDLIDEEVYTMIKELHQAKENKDIETVKEIAAQLKEILQAKKQQAIQSN